jgi:RNA polymerase sigma factor (sigma-70 family)
MTTLSAADELTYLALAQTGDSQSRDRLVADQVPLMRYWASHFSRTSHAEFDDLMSEAALALLHAIGNFNLTSGCRLSTYATPKIRGRLARWVRIESNALGSKAMLSPEARRLAKCVREGRSVEAAMLGLTGERMRALLDLMTSYVTCLRDDFDACLHAGDSPEDIAIANEDLRGRRGRLAALLGKLSKRERTIIALRYLEPESRSKASIGREISRSRELVRQIETRAIAKMRSAAAWL